MKPFMAMNSSLIYQNRNVPISVLNGALCMEHGYGYAPVIRVKITELELSYNMLATRNKLHDINT